VSVGTMPNPVSDNRCGARWKLVDSPKAYAGRASAGAARRSGAHVALFRILYDVEHIELSSE